MQPIGRVTRPLLRDLFRREEARLALVRARWPELVGETLARRIVPWKFEGGVLELRVSDPRWERAARDVQAELLRKLSADVPEAAVTRIGIVAAGPASRRPDRSRAH